MAPRGQSICTRCATGAETPEDRERRKASNLADPSGQKMRNFSSGFKKLKKNPKP